MADVNDGGKPDTGPGLEPDQVAALDVLAGEAEAELDQRAGVAGPAPETIPEPAGPASGELLLPLVTIAAATLAPAWNLKVAECEALAYAYGAIIDKYWPGGMGSMGVEINAAMLTAAIIQSRWKIPRFTVVEGEETEPPKVPEQEPGRDNGKQDFLKPDEPARRKTGARSKTTIRTKAA